MSASPFITRETRRAHVLAAMQKAGLDRLVLASNGLHMIDLDNPVAHLAGFRSVGPCLITLQSDGRMRVLASPSDEAARIESAFPSANHVATDDMAGALAGGELPISKGRTGFVGLGAMPRRLASAMEAQAGSSCIFDRDFYAATAIKTADEIDSARRATRIAEKGYERLQELAHPGMPECDLAVEVNQVMKSLGAEDCFHMLCAGPRSDAVMPSSERRLETGDLILTELSPSVDGQFVQICRTLSLGEPRQELQDGYTLLVAAMLAGIREVRPGQRMGAVCSAIDDLLSEAGYAQYSRPPFIRRRGHGLGSGSTQPGDVAVDNDTILEDGMLFIVHPNQFLPETGYMMCGEPLVVRGTGAEILSRNMAALATIPVRGAA